MKSKLEEWLALDHADGELPPGLWAVAGRFRGEYGVYVGFHKELQGFIPENRVEDNIRHLKKTGQADLARMLKNIQPDIAKLKSGEQKLVMDLQGKRLPEFRSK